MICTLASKQGQCWTPKRGKSVQDGRLKALEEEQKQIESNLQLLGQAETSAGVDFLNQLTTAQLLLQIEIGDASFRRDRLK